jgi:galactose mutarotase-like enzyme
MFTIENENLRVTIKKKGAEMDGLFNKETGIDYLWNADPKVWPKKSPILFPIVGNLKNKTYLYKDKPYRLPRHGFARDNDFELTAQSPDSLTMTLRSNNRTLAVYPFTFRLDLVYTLISGALHVKYIVYNEGDENMYFSIGGHPAFKLPLEKGLSYDDYYIEFAQIEDANRWQISPQGLIEPTAVPCLINNNRLDLSKELFRNDAVVFKYLNSESVGLKTKKSKHGVRVSFPRFPFFALWATPNADFVCLEPWCGIADGTTSDQQLINKEGINLLTAGQTFEREWAVEVY